MSDGAACQVLHPLIWRRLRMWAGEGSGHRCFLLRVLGATAQSPCLFPTKSFHLPLEFLPSPPFSIPPSLCVGLSLSPLSPNMLQGDEDRFGCIITPVLSVPGSRQSLTKLNLWGEFAGTVRKGIQLTFTSGWLTLAQWDRMYTFLGGGGGIQTFYQPFDYLLLGVKRF